MRTLVVIPTFNEAENIGKLIPQILAQEVSGLDIMVVDDASPDGTAQVVEDLAKKDTRVGIIKRSGKLGLGTAYVAGFKHALKNNYEEFVQEELKQRKACNLPPYWRLAVMLLRDKDFEKLQTACNVMRERIDAVVAQGAFEVAVRGPIPAILSRLQRYHRMQIILQAPNAAIINKLFTNL